MPEHDPQTLLLVHEVLQAVLHDLVEIVERRTSLVIDELYERQRQLDLPLEDEPETSADIRVF